MQEVVLFSPVWPHWRKVWFRFFFILFLFIAAPWTWPNVLPGVDWLVERYNELIDWVVANANSTFLHVRPMLVPLNGSGDTSFGWAALWTYSCLAIAGCIVWSLLDRKRENYRQLNYWLCVVLRYYLAMTALGYGIAKVFLTQMPFPNTSELATPLGDFLPMRLSWMFIGYSAPYQFFSGLVECLVGLLLLFRRTATLGAMLSAGVFLNVAMLNLSYDIPVKIFSLQMVAISLFLLGNEWQRITRFFLLNRPAEACSIYDYPLRKRWMRVGRIVFKCCFIVLAVGVSTAQTAELRAYYNRASYEALKPGLYEVSEHQVNGLALPAYDSLRWKDIALDGKRSGSIRTEDPVFDAIYGRRYFVYDVDTQQHQVMLRRQSDDSLIATLQYKQPDTVSILLAGLYKGDSVHILFRRSTHHFQLTERQFHWVSEANR